MTMPYMKEQPRTLPPTTQRDKQRKDGLWWMQGDAVRRQKHADKLAKMVRIGMGLK